MSKVKISGNASGTGTLTISAPATNTDRSLTLPDGAGEILLSDGDGSNLTGVGKVLQVVQGTTSTNVTISGTTYTDTTLSATITPTSTTSKILVLVNQMTYIYGTSSAQVNAGIKLLRGSTAILTPFTDTAGPLEPYLEIGNATEVYNTFRHTINYLDSPSTTSATTYKTQGALRNTGSGRILRFQVDSTVNGTSTIILMEIAG